VNCLYTHSFSRFTTVVVMIPLFKLAYTHTYTNKSVVASVPSVFYMLDTPANKGQ